nr:MAG TPA: hypothetical protein [Caudoviricetes sp.]
MTKVSDQILQILYAHLSVQSILDMKDNYNEVSIRQLNDMNKNCCASFPIKVDHRVMAIIFVFDAKEVYNIVVYTCSHFMREKENCFPQLEKIVKELAEKKEINAIVYKQARQILSSLTSVGFNVRKEKEKYIVLEYKK